MAALCSAGRLRGKLPFFFFFFAWCALVSLSLSVAGERRETTRRQAASCHSGLSSRHGALRCHWALPGSTLAPLGAAEGCASGWQDCTVSNVGGQCQDPIGPMTSVFSTGKRPASQWAVAGRGTLACHCEVSRCSPLRLAPERRSLLMPEERLAQKRHGADLVQFMNAVFIPVIMDKARQGCLGRIRDAGTDPVTLKTRVTWDGTVHRGLRRHGCQRTECSLFETASSPTS